MRRRALAAALAPRMAALFRELHGDIPVSLLYRSHPEVEAAPDEAGVRGALAHGLAERRSLDERRRFTGFGPQTDDLEIGLGGALARSHASQGQLRSLMLALKLAELTEIGERLGDPPVLVAGRRPERAGRAPARVAFRGREPARLPDADLGDGAGTGPGVRAIASDFEVRGGVVSRIPMS